MMPDDRQNGYTVARLGEDDKMHADRWAIINNGETVAMVSYELARLFWLGRLTLAELAEMVGGGHDKT